VPADRTDGTDAVDHLRPTAHFATRKTWLNDPNGLLHHDGVFHLFFQNNPRGSTWGNMSWGHATSTDLTTWTEQPVAITADEQEEIFSGSAVIDTRNTAGFAGPGQTALVAIYTSNYTQASPRPGLQAQSLAYSLDAGATWQRYRDNPVLDTQRSDFRDPKVFWYGGEDGCWIMVTVEANDRRVAIYSSPDLKRWTFRSHFGPAHATGGVWECPDLFPVSIRGTNEHRWVLVVSLNPGGVAGGSGTQYFVGHFDGHRFTADRLTSSDPGDHDWLDYGRDYYAAVSFHAAPDDRRLTMAWASNWDYANSTPTHPWRSAISLVRELELVRRRDGRLALSQTPVLPADGTGCVIAELEIPSGAGQRHEVRLTDAGGDCEVLLTFDGDTRTMSCDRTASGDVSFHPSFACVDVAPLVGDDSTQVLVVLDGCVLEIFLDGGLTTLTQLVFPCSPLQHVSTVRV
jgi:sucrose-6-phosphate hydrolase SacC (GH32 family)